MEKKYKYSPTRLGEKILNDWDNFQYDYIGKEKNGEIYKFNWQWAGMKGFANISLGEFEKIDCGSVIDTNEGIGTQFLRPHSPYNDDSLYDLFKRMLNEKNRWD